MGASAYGKNHLSKKIDSLIKFEKMEISFLNLKYFNHYMFHRPGYVNKSLENFLD